jgi:hypothetical protein
MGDSSEVRASSEAVNFFAVRGSAFADPRLSMGYSEPKPQRRQTKSEQKGAY